MYSIYIDNKLASNHSSLRAAKDAFLNTTEDAKLVSPDSLIIAKRYEGVISSSWLGGPEREAWYKKFKKCGRKPLVRKPKTVAPAEIQPPAVTVKTICQDVIDRVNNSRLIPVVGCTIRTDNFKYLPREESFQAYVKENTCQVCAKGALLCTWVEKFNNFTVREVVRANQNSCQVDNIPAGILELFGEKLIAKIESAYERGNDCSWNFKIIGEDECMKYKSRYNLIRNDSDRLKQIMQDIIDDKF